MADHPSLPGLFHVPSLAGQEAAYSLYSGLWSPALALSEPAVIKPVIVSLVLIILSQLACAEKKPVARILGKDISREDCLSPSSGIGSPAVGLELLVAHAMMDEFGKAEPIALTADDIKAYIARVAEVRAKMAKSGPKVNRQAAIKLLSKMDSNPNIDLGVRGFLDDRDVDMRFTAYECLRRRRDSSVRVYPLNGRFKLEMVDARKPLIYLTQTGDPRIVIFGDNTELLRPMSANIWNGRLLMRADMNDPNVQIFYRSTPTTNPTIDNVPAKLSTLTSFMARPVGPRGADAGIALPYSETINALHTLWNAGYIPGDFKGEQDRLLAAIMKEETRATPVERPEFPSEESVTDALVTRPTESPTKELENKPKIMDTVPR